MAKKQLIALLAPLDQLEPLLRDLQSRQKRKGGPRWTLEAQYDRLLLLRGENPCSPWAQNVWLNPELIPFDSISDASKRLRAIQRNWVLFPSNFHGRAKLIQEALPVIRFKPLAFPSPLPQAPLGSWTLVENKVMLASAQCSSPFPHGEPQFAENKTEPPSRAYLKLWETFTLLEQHPGKGELCLDAGACPGGWTWVLSKCGAQVVAVDRSPLAAGLLKDPRVKFVKGNAFSKEVAESERFDWIFSDVACYPEKLLEWVTMMIELHPQAKFVCTIKFQGDKQALVTEQFAEIPDSRLFHLANNKHELTWVRLPEG